MVYSHLSAYNMFLANSESRLLFAFRGVFSDALTERIIGISESLNGESPDAGMVNRKVSFLLVECFQNILRHREESRHNGAIPDDGMFCYQATHGAYYINSLNTVRNSIRASLSEAVDKINSMSPEELRAYHKQQLQENSFNEKGGAGLGLIELARKSGQKLKYRFDDISDEYAYFQNQVCFLTNCPAPKNHMDSTSQLYHQMVSEDVVLLYKGDFSQRSILPLFHIVQSNLAAGDLAHAKRVAHILIELLQNISRHSLGTDDGRQGVFLVSRAPNGKLRIRTGNIVATASTPALKSKLDLIISLDDQGLKALHGQQFIESLKLEDKSRAGLGLIQVARAASAKLEYELTTIDSEKTFFSLTVEV
ncbi:MAG: hypothetical protein RL226_1507 [Bacteroidota bacterium]|jgi:anti-sigma regulatory factor (Ser/Thr protein kinase)